MKTASREDSAQIEESSRVLNDSLNESMLGTASQSKSSSQQNNKSVRPVANPWIARSIVICVVAAGAGALAFTASKVGHNDGDKKALAEPTRTPVLTVSVQTPKTEAVARELAVHGTISAWDPITVGASAGGLEIKSIQVDEGQVVKKGQLLATLDSSQLQAQLQSEKARLASATAAVTKSIQPNRPEDINTMVAAVAQAEATVSDSEAALVQARANLEDANSNIKRYQFLKKEGAVSAQEAEVRETTAKVTDAIVRSAEHKVTAAKSSLKQYQEKLAMAQIGGRREDIDIAHASVNEIRGNVRKLETQIAETFIKAPVDGLITRRDAHLGDISTAGKAMFLMARDNRLELKAQVPENDLQYIKTGEIVSIDTSLGGIKKITGIVREISPLIDSDLRLATARIDVPVESGLKSGMYAEGHIHVGKYSALTIPSLAVISRDEKSTIFVLHKDQVERRIVQLGNRANNNIEVISGVKDSEQIVTDGAGFLKDGDYVAVAKN